MEHYQLIQEMPSIERMSTQDRLKHAKKRRAQQLKRYSQYEKQLEKGSKSKKKGIVTQQQRSVKKPKHHPSDRVQFVANIALLESAARNDLEEGKSDSIIYIHLYLISNSLVKKFVTIYVHILLS